MYTHTENICTFDNMRSNVKLQKIRSAYLKVQTF